MNTGNENRRTRVADVGGGQFWGTRPVGSRGEAQRQTHTTDVGIEGIETNKLQTVRFLLHTGHLPRHAFVPVELVHRLICTRQTWN